MNSTIVPRLAVSLMLTMFAPAVRAGEPAVPISGLFKPTFLLLNRSFSGGTAFLVQVPGRSEALLVTPQHLFGPATGQEAQMTPDDIAQSVRGAVGLSMQDKTTIVVASKYLKVADARPVDRNGADRDVALFAVQWPAKIDTFQ